MFRVITNPELHRAIMVVLLHPINTASRVSRIRKILSQKSTSGEKSLLEKLLCLGLGVSDSLDSITARLSIESNHPELLKIREQQIAGITTKLRSSSHSSNGALSRMLLNDATQESFSDGSKCGSPDHGTRDPVIHNIGDIHISDDMQSPEA